MADFFADVDPELTIVVRAQQIVDRWRRLTRVVPFERVLRQALELDSFLASPARRQVVEHVVDAVRSGEGHAFRIRGPLLAIARQGVRRQATGQDDRLQAETIGPREARHASAHGLVDQSQRAASRASIGAGSDD